MSAATDPRILELSGDLVVHAARLVRAARRSTRDAPSAGIRILSLLDEFGPLGVGRLATLDRSSQPTMTGAVNGLVERGWVTKQPHPDDARASVITPSATGKAALAEVRRTHAEAVAARVGAHPNISAEDLATAVAVLREVLAPSEEKGSL